MLTDAVPDTGHSPAGFFVNINLFVHVIVFAKMPGKHWRYVDQSALTNICDYVLNVLWKRHRGVATGLFNLLKEHMRIGIVAYRHLEPVLGIHSNATDGRDHGIALSPGSGRVRKLCLLPHHRVLRLELVLFVPGRVFVVCLCILAMYRPVFARHLRKENDIHERIYTHVIDTEETYWRMACVGYRAWAWKRLLVKAVFFDALTKITTAGLPGREVRYETWSSRVRDSARLVFDQNNKDPNKSLVPLCTWASPLAASFAKSRPVPKHPVEHPPLVPIVCC